MCLEDGEVCLSLWDTDSVVFDTERSQLTSRGETPYHQKKARHVPGAACTASWTWRTLYRGWRALEDTVPGRESCPCWKTGRFSLPTSLPLFREGSFRGMLMIPTRSSVGTRERRMDRIRMASPFPVWMSCNVRLKKEIRWMKFLHLHSTPATHFWQ